MPQVVETHKPRISTSTPYAIAPKTQVCQQIAQRLGQYAAQGYPVDVMDAEITYLPGTRLAVWRLVVADHADPMATYAVAQKGIP